ncbi:MAG: DMT family transporter [Bacteroidales bacterium]|nr:DMT family transporter [Bacteroidales bacterium]
MGSPKNVIYYFMLLLSVTFWGVSFVFTKSLLDSVTPIALVFFRMVIASVLLATVCRIFFHQKLREVPRKDWLLLLCLSLFEPFLYFLFETYSLSVVSEPTIVSVIVATIPIFTVFMSHFYFKEKLTWFNFVGVFVSALGIAIMLLPELSDQSFQWLGVFLAFGAVFSSVGYSFFLKKLSDQYHPVFIVTTQTTFGIFWFLPLLLILHSPEELAFQFANLARPEILRNVLALAVLCSALAFVLYIWALQRVGLGKSNTFTNLIPVVTALFSFLFLGENFPLLKIIGTAVTIIGVCCVQYTPRNNGINI